MRSQLTPCEDALCKLYCTSLQSLVEVACHPMASDAIAMARAGQWQWHCQCDNQCVSRRDDHGDLIIMTHVMSSSKRKRRFPIVARGMIGAVGGGVLVKNASG